MDALLNWIAHWLPLVQGFAALASIGGALLSWRFALRAQRAREEMLQNAISARLLATIERVLAELNNFRATAVDSNGSPDPVAYVQSGEHHKRLLEELFAETTAAKAFTQVRPEVWSAMVSKVLEASANPQPAKLEYVCKYLAMASAELKISATKRQLSPTQ